MMLIRKVEKRVNQLLTPTGGNRIGATRAIHNLHNVTIETLNWNV